MPIRLRLLGGARIENDDGPVRGRAAHRRRLGLLAILSASPDGSATRDRLIGLLWPEHPEEGARKLLSEALYVIRKELGEGTLTAAGDEIRLDTALVESDLHTFLAAVAAGDPSLLTSGAAQSLATHRVVWAAEEARRTGTVVTLPG